MRRAHDIAHRFFFMRNLPPLPPHDRPPLLPPRDPSLPNVRPLLSIDIPITITLIKTPTIDFYIFLGIIFPNAIVVGAIEIVLIIL
jgi:hypothetical protein